MNRETVRRNLLNSGMKDNEDLPVIEYLESLEKNKIFDFLEVGSGLCRFVDKIRVLYPNLRITCLEINENLANLAKNKNYEVINKDILDSSLPEERYDIVHCSHVLEHFGHPEVTRVIDELLRITKKGGVCIIRSPLMWEEFYFDIDHVRPYPPEAILRYLESDQQQKKGRNEVEVLNTWYRTRAKQYHLIDKGSIWSPFKILREFINKRILCINRKMKASWKRYRFPASKSTGYVMIMKKLQ